MLILHVISDSKHDQDDSNQRERNWHHNNRQLRLLLHIIDIDGDFLVDKRDLIPHDDENGIWFGVIEVMSEMELTRIQWMPYFACLVGRCVIQWGRKNLQAIVVWW